jgi:HEAT repeat protein
MMFRRSLALVLPLGWLLAACGGDSPLAGAQRASPGPAALAGESRARATERGVAPAGGAMREARMEERMGDESGAPGMAAAAPARLDDPEPEAREQAIYEVVPEGAGVQQLAAIAGRDPDARVRRAAVMQLAAGEGPAVAPALVAALRDSDAGVVEEALVALAAAGDARAADHVRPLLAHPDPEIRSLAEETIDLLADPR